MYSFSCIHFQDANYNKFLNNSDKVHGKGPTQFDRDQNDQNAEKKYISSAIESIRMGSFFHDEEEFVSPDVLFKPSFKAKHRVPYDMRAGVQHPQVPHKLSHNHSTSKKFLRIPVPIATSTPKKLPHHAGRDRNPKYDSDFHDFLEPNNYDLVPRPIEMKKLECNIVKYVTIPPNSLVCHCQGCSREITQQKYFWPPLNLLFQYKMFHKFPHPKKAGERTYDPVRQNGYFHSNDMCCIRNHDELRNLRIEDVYMSNRTFLHLEDSHFEELMWHQHLELVLITQCQLKQHADN